MLDTFDYPIIGILKKTCQQRKKVNGPVKLSKLQLKLKKKIVFIVIYEDTCWYNKSHRDDDRSPKKSPLLHTTIHFTFGLIMGKLVCII